MSLFEAYPKGEVYLSEDSRITYQDLKPYIQSRRRIPPGKVKDITPRAMQKDPHFLSRGCRFIVAADTDTDETGQLTIDPNTSYSWSSVPIRRELRRVIGKYSCQLGPSPFRHDIFPIVQSTEKGDKVIKFIVWRAPKVSN